MEPHVYKDSDGSIVQAVSSSIPGLSLVPAGFSISDAQPISHEEFQALGENHPVLPTQPTITTLQAQIDELKALVHTLTKP